MSNFGLEVRNGQGFSSLDPDSFTVKLVESVWVGWDYLEWNTVVDVPTTSEVLAGMFPVVTVYQQLPYNYPMQNDFEYMAVIWCMPVVEVYNGFIRVKGTGVLGTRAYGMVVVSVMKYT